jgi:1-acyl-sn-glycerol-3-phosphate acyltransferase
VRALTSFALGRRRDLARDAREVLGRQPVRPRVEGAEHIPADGPFLIVANHYERPGLWVLWGAWLITAAVGQRRPRGPHVRWVHISEWTDYVFYGIRLPSGFTRRYIEAASRTWGILPIPPPGRQSATGARALLRVARAVEGAGEVIGIFPEGEPSVALRPAVPGSGGLLLLLTANGLPVVPVGLFEPDGILTARFGPPFRLEVPRGGPAEQRDEAARQRVMQAVRDQLPPELWGYYAEPDGRAGRPEPTQS